MTRLIDADELKQYIDDCKCCEKCDKIGFMCNEHCELPDFLTLQWERVLNEQPTVDAIPTAWILDWIQYMEQYYGYYTEIIHAMLEDWRTERNE